MKFIRLLIAVLCGAGVSSAGGLKPYVPRVVSGGSASVTNAFIQGVNTALGAATTTNSYTVSGMPAAVKAVVAVTNSVPYVTFALAPICTNAPSIIGTPYQYNTFTSSAGGWIGSMAATTTNYQWLVSGSEIGGQTSDTFTASASTPIQLRIILSNQYGSVTNYSNEMELTRVHYHIIPADTPSLDSENLGSGYTDQDVVTMSDGIPDTAATFTLTVTDGVVTGFTISNSGDYPAPFSNGSHSVTGGTGSGLKIITGADCWELFTP